MSSLHPVVLVLYWIALTLSAGGAAALSVLAWRRSTPIAYAASGALLLALLAAAVPAGGGGFALNALITLLALVTATAGGGPFARVALALSTRGSVPDGEHGGILRGGAEVLRGGTAIGVLERIAVAGTILAGFPEGIAVVVAIKGVGRFSELDDAATRERFIIGTLASLVWACAAAGVAVLARS